MFDGIDPIIQFRLLERLVLTCIVILVALVVLVGFWRSVQKIDLTGAGKLGIAGSFALSTPVFALIAVIGYAYVSLAHPISVQFGDGQPGARPEATEVASTAGTQAFLGGVPSGPGGIGSGDSAANAYDRQIVARQIRSLNCLGADAQMSPRVADDLADVKLRLMREVWDPAWGEGAAFSDWARGVTRSQPSAAALQIFDAVQVQC